jgi:hypothetical protein
MVDEQTESFLTIPQRRIGSLEVLCPHPNPLLQFVVRPTQLLLHPLTIGNVIPDRQKARLRLEHDHVGRDVERPQFPAFHPHQHFKVSDRPFTFQSLDKFRPILRVRPDPQQQRRLSDDLVSAESECCDAGVINFETDPGLQLGDTDRVRTEAEGFGE